MILPLAVQYQLGWHFINHCLIEIATEYGGSAFLNQKKKRQDKRIPMKELPRKLFFLLEECDMITSNPTEVTPEAA